MADLLSHPLDIARQCKTAPIRVLVLGKALAPTISLIMSQPPKDTLSGYKNPFRPSRGMHSYPVMMDHLLVDFVYFDKTIYSASHGSWDVLLDNEHMTGLCNGSDRYATELKATRTRGEMHRTASLSMQSNGMGGLLEIKGDGASLIHLHPNSAWRFGDTGVTAGQTKR